LSITDSIDSRRKKPQSQKAPLYPLGEERLLLGQSVRFRAGGKGKRKLKGYEIRERNLTLILSNTMMI